jgi:hypothetical protein
MHVYFATPSRFALAAAAAAAAEWCFRGCAIFLADGGKEHPVAFDVSAAAAAAVAWLHAVPLLLLLLPVTGGMSPGS